MIKVRLNHKYTYKNTSFVYFILIVLLPILFAVINYGLLKVEFNIPEFLCCILVSTVCITIFHRNRDILDPRFYFPILYFSIYVLGDFTFYQYEIVPSKMWLFYIAGLIGFYLGTELAQHSTKVYINNSDSRRDLIYTKARYFFILYIFLCCVIKTYLYTRNGIPLFSSNIDKSRQLATESVGYLSAIIYGFNLVPIFFTYDILTRKKYDVKIHKINYIIIGICLLFDILDVSRLLLIQIIVPILFIYIKKYKKISIRKMIILVVLVIIYIGANQIIRNVRLNSNYLQYVSSSRSTNLLQNILISSLNNFRVAVDDLYKLIIIVPARSDYTYGKMFLNSILTVLPGNQVTIGYYVADLLGLSFDGMGAATTILGMFYLDGGIVLIIAGMFLFGFLIQFFYKKYIEFNTFDIYHLLPVYVLYYSILSIRTNVMPNIEPLLATFYYLMFSKIIKRVR